MIASPPETGTMRVSVGPDGVGGGVGVSETIGVDDGSVLGLEEVDAFLQLGATSATASAAARMEDFKDGFFIWSDGKFAGLGAES
jgi:hypothetical protein